MNCCDDYGQCKQGHGCPARETKETKMAHTTESLMELADAYGKLLAYHATDDYMVCDDGKKRFALQSAITELVAERDALVKEAARAQSLHEMSLARIQSLDDCAKEYNDLILHMNAGGDFHEFQVALSFKETP